MNYIYILKDPQTNEIRYVGQTVNPLKRKYSHRSKLKGKNYLNNWLVSLFAAGFKPEFHIIAETFNNELANILECFYIKYYINAGYRLTNLTNGGKSNIMSKNHNSLKLKNNTLESYYGVEKANAIKNKISKAMRNNNPFLGRHFRGDILLKQIVANSKNPLIIFDKINNKWYEFVGSMDAARQLNINSSNIRQYKNKDWCVGKQYLIYDKNNPKVPANIEIVRMEPLIFK